MPLAYMYVYVCACAAKFWNGKTIRDNRNCKHAYTKVFRCLSVFMEGACECSRQFEVWYVLATRASSDNHKLNGAISFPKINKIFPLTIIYSLLKQNVHTHVCMYVGLLVVTNRRNKHLFERDWNLPIV